MQTLGSPLEQLILLRERCIDGCLHGIHYTLKFGHVKTCAEARGEQFVGDVQGGHDGDALDRCDLAGIADFAHFFVKIINHIKKFGALVFRACDTQFAIQYRNIKGLNLVAVNASSGNCTSNFCRRVLAVVILSLHCRCLLSISANAWRNWWFSERKRWLSLTNWPNFCSSASSSFFTLGL